MRKALKEDLGADSEELVRFGIQPFRGLKFTPRPSRARKKPGNSSEIPEPSL
jgi:hypothetical protein